jgi:glycosyltransferase involved in cell wall biosynthesis
MVTSAQRAPAPAVPGVSRRLRVLHLLPHARQLGGSERTVLDMLASPELAHLEQRVGFVQGGPVVGFADDQVLGAGRPPVAVLRAARRWRPDVVHGWLLQGNLLGTAIKAFDRSLVLVTSERNVGHALTPPKLVLKRLVASAEDAATANSAAVRAAAIARVPRRAAAMRLIAPGVAAPARPERVVEASAVMVGRLHPVKDHATALRAWRRVLARHPEATLSIVGGGPQRAVLESLAAQLGLAEAVSFQGEADPAPHVYGASVFLLSSRAEGFSRALVEALAAGVPAVCTAVGGVEELPDAAVRRAPVGDDAALADGLNELLGDPGALASARTAALAAAQRYSPARAHRAFADLYAELVRA